MDENQLYDAEVSPKEILRIMKTNVYDTYFKNSYHFISSEYLLSRSSLFSLIRKISNQMGFKSQTFFLSIYYLDILFSKNKKIDCNYKILGLACLLLSSKYVENDPCIPNLATFIKVYNNIVGYKYIISATDLFYAEVLTCKMLGYKLNYYTIYDFDSFFFGHGIIKIEQLRELNNGIYSNFMNGNNFEINSSNSIVIRKILEKIYHKSRQLLELIVNNSNICLKYNSLLISIFIMKKSVEEILFEEQRINKHDLLSKERFITKTSRYFKEIMKELYQIDYESIEEYNALISDKDLIKLLQEEKKNELSPALINLENNIRLADDSNTFVRDNNIKDYNFRENYNRAPSYYHMNRLKSNNKKHSNNNVINTNVKESQIFKKMDLNRDLSKYNKFKIIISENSYRLSSPKKNSEKSIQKKNPLIPSYLDLNSISNIKELKNNKINRPFRHSEMNCVKYLKKCTTYNEFGNKRNESISTKTNNNKSISIDNNDDIIDIIKSLDNEDNKTKTINIDSPLKQENDNINIIEKIRKIGVLKNKLFKGDMFDKKKDNSIVLIDNSNTTNTIDGETITNDDNLNNLDKYKSIGKPYFRKVIRNAINRENTNNYNKAKNFKETVKTKSISFLSKNNENNGKKREFNSIISIPLPSSKISQDKDGILNNLDSNTNRVDNIKLGEKYIYDDSEKKNNYSKSKTTKDNNNNDIKSKIRRIRENHLSINNNNMTQRNSFFNAKKKIDEIYKTEKKDENKENQNNNDVKENKEDKEKETEVNCKGNEISKYSSSSNFYLNKRREREKLLLNRMNHIKKNDNDKENKDEKINKTIFSTKNTNYETKDDINDKNIETNIKTKDNKSSDTEAINDYLKSKKNTISKRKFFLSNKKQNDYKSDIKGKNNMSTKDSRLENTYEKGNILYNSINKENNYTSIRQKYMNKMHIKKKENNNILTDVIMNNDKEEQEKKNNIKEDNKNINDNNKRNNFDIRVNKVNRKRESKNSIRNITNENEYIKRKEKKEEKENNNYIKKDKEIKVETEPKSNFAKKYYPTSSIIKLLNRTKNLANDNELEISKEKLKIELPNNYNFNKRKTIVKTIETIDHCENRSENKDKIETDITKNEKIPRVKLYKTINVDIDKNEINNNNNERVIHSYHHRNLLKNKIRKSCEENNMNNNNASNNNINIETNKTTNTIVINNNININFNNKIEPIRGRRIHNNILKRNTTEISNNKDYFNKIIISKSNKNNNSHQKTIIEKYYDNNNDRNKIIGKDYCKKGTIECINSNKNINVNNQNYSISSLLHRLPIYKNTLDNNRKVLSRETSLNKE